MQKTLLLIGCGTMGYAMLTGWLEKDPSLNVHIIDPAEPNRQRAQDIGAKTYENLDTLPANLSPELVILAVKPYLVLPILEQCRDLAMSKDTCFISVAAGITLDQMKEVMPPQTPLIRCMPNTPASIGEGMLVLCACPPVAEAMREWTEQLFSASGAVLWLEDEAMMDAVTAISGSGPAYVFYFIEGLIEAGISLGLSEETATLLAQQTVAGSGRMALQSTHSAKVLKEQVAVPNGTTEAAINIFKKDEGLVRLINEASRAARDRSIELRNPST